MIVREEGGSDFPQIRHLLMEAFGRPHESLLVEDVRKAGKAVISLVAEEEGRIAGHILFTEVSIEPPAPSWRALGLAPLAVLPSCQGRGVGTRLVGEGIRACWKAGYTSLFVLGDPKYYSRFGFRPASTFGIGSRYDAGDAFMALETAPGSLSRCRGTVAFPPEFEGV